MAAPFKSMGGRDYRAMYADAYTFHERHNPPSIGSEQTEIDYWMKSAKDMTELANRHGNDTFMNALLIAIYAELEREYKSQKEEPHGEQTETRGSIDRACEQ